MSIIYNGTIFWRSFLVIRRRITRIAGGVVHGIAVGLGLNRRPKLRGEEEVEAVPKSLIRLQEAVLEPWCTVESVLARNGLLVPPLPVIRTGSVPLMVLLEDYRQGSSESREESCCET